MSEFEFLPPALTLDALGAVALRHYGIDGQLRLLNSERDQNARVEAASG